MASLVLRKDTWHLVWRWRGKPKWQSTKVSHDGKYKAGKPVPPAAAKYELRKLEASLESGHSYESKTLEALLVLVEKDYTVSGYKSVASLNSRLNHLRDFFGSIRADRITDMDLLEYAEARQKPKNGKAGAANQTIDNELDMLMKALRMGNIHPLPKRKKLRHPAPRQGFFDDAKIAALVRKLPDYIRGPALFGYYTGWRREEVFGLEWSAVDFEAGEVRLWDSKTNAHRSFPLDAVDGLRQLLTDQRAAQKAWTVQGVQAVNPTALVFARRLKKNGAIRRVTDFRKVWNSACVRAGIPEMLFHDLRRSAARNLELAGWPRTLIMQWMGHETDAMFLRYRIVSAADREIVSKVIAERNLRDSKSLKIMS